MALKKWSMIAINDVFDELKDDNKRLLNVLLFSNKCLNEYKSFVEMIFTKYSQHFESQDVDYYQQNLKKSAEEVLNIDNQFKLLLTEVKSESNIETNDDNNGFVFEVNSDYISGNEVIGVNSEECDDKSDPDFEPKYEMMSTEDKLSKTKPKSKRRRGKYKPKVDLKKRREQMLDICDFCGHELTSGESRILHIRKHLSRYYYKSTDPNEKNEYVCDHIGCDYRSTNQNYFIGHLNEHKGVKPFECSSCGKPFPNAYRLKQHIQIFHKLFDQTVICGYNGCKKQFDNEYKFKKHRDNHTKEKLFDCDYPDCGKSFKNRPSLRIHRLVHTSDRPFKCTVNGCEKSYTNQKTLNIHLRSHSTERNFRCTHEGCHKSFKMKGQLNGHINIVHAEKHLLCDWPGCDYKTNNKATLKYHCKQVHSEVRDYSCDWNGCGKAFKARTQLMTHLKIHRGEKNYQCYWPGCQYRCVQKSNLDHHVLTHSSDLNYACDWPDCDKRLKTKRSLKKHIETHTNTK